MNGEKWDAMSVNDRLFNVVVKTGKWDLAYSHWLANHPWSRLKPDVRRIVAPFLRDK